jgi:hypothetical protein
MPKIDAKSLPEQVSCVKFKEILDDFDCLKVSDLDFETGCLFSVVNFNFK